MLISVGKKKLRNIYICAKNKQTPQKSRTILKCQPNNRNRVIILLDKSAIHN